MQRDQKVVAAAIGARDVPVQWFRGGDQRPAAGAGHDRAGQRMGEHAVQKPPGAGILGRQLQREALTPLVLAKGEKGEDGRAGIDGREPGALAREPLDEGTRRGLPRGLRVGARLERPFAGADIEAYVEALRWRNRLVQPGRRPGTQSLKPVGPAPRRLAVLLVAQAGAQRGGIGHGPHELWHGEARRFDVMREELPELERILRRLRPPPLKRGLKFGAARLRRGEAQALQIVRRHAAGLPEIVEDLRKLAEKRTLLRRQRMTKLLH